MKNQESKVKVKFLKPNGDLRRDLVEEVEVTIGDILILAQKTEIGLRPLPPNLFEVKGFTDNGILITEQFVSQGKMLQVIVNTLDYFFYGKNPKLDSKFREG